MDDVLDAGGDDAAATHDDDDDDDDGNVAIRSSNIESCMVHSFVR